ncbi:MAG: ABC transporter ATP-binding protein [Alphaproteobacteria bacterium]|nr:ABC transporter ATP-binding protein [Alphaproteobacteria bacterium]
MAGLTLEAVSHAYGNRPAVRDLSLAVEAGEVVCLLGPSGCGKSTTLRLVAGLEPLLRGRIAIGGATVSGPGALVPPERRGVGLVFQDYALFPHLSVSENVAFGLGGPVAERRARVQAMLAGVGLTHLAGAYPHTLSGGEQQRVGLARALAPAPRVMLMDEPFSGLDVRLRDQVRDDTLRLLKSSGAATLLVTHDPEEAMRMADRIALMRGGHLVQEGTPAHLYARPKDAFVAKFFSEINELSVGVRLEETETPFGRWPAEGVRDGAAVMLIRPEAVRIGDGMAQGLVREVRSLGPYNLVWLTLAHGEELLARIDAGRAPAQGSQVPVGLDPAGTFIFGAE